MKIKQPLTLKMYTFYVDNCEHFLFLILHNAKQFVNVFLFIFLITNVNVCKCYCVIMYYCVYL